MSFQNLRQISERYARDGNRQDIDEFRAEMNRVKEEQRFQTIERYITDLYVDYPYLVRNRQYQFIPVRNQRLSELVQIAANQQTEAYRQQALLQSAVDAKAVADAKVRQDALDAAKKAAAAIVPEVSTNVTWLLIAAASLLVLLFILLIFMAWQLMSRSAPVTIIEKQVERVEREDMDPSITASTL